MSKVSFGCSSVDFVCTQSSAAWLCVVLAAQVVDVGGRDQRPAELARVADDALVRLRLLGDPVLLDLEVDVVGAEDLDQVVEVGAGVGRALLDQPAAEARLQAAGERDHALGVAVEQLHVDVRLAALEALEEAGRGELDQVAKAGVVGGEQGQVVALDPALGAAVVDQVGLEPEDRLDPVLATGLVVLDRAVHHPVVGEPERRHPELGRRREPRSPCRPLLTILQAPSSSEYSLWTCRWTTLALTEPIIASGPDANRRRAGRSRKLRRSRP